MQYLENLIKEKSLTSCIEFGSGQSTKLLTQIGIDFISLDDNYTYAEKNPNVSITDLKQLDDNTFNQVVNGEINYVDIQDNFNTTSARHTRQKNCFYKIPVDKVNKKFDLVILDGPNGNGRSIAYNFIKPYLTKVSYILVDDFTHYPFIEHLTSTFPNSTLVKQHQQGRDEWCVYKVQM